MRSRGPKFGRETDGYIALYLPPESGDVTIKTRGTRDIRRNLERLWEFNEPTTPRVSFRIENRGEGGEGTNRGARAVPRHIDTAAEVAVYRASTYSTGRARTYMEIGSRRYIFCLQVNNGE